MSDGTLEVGPVGGASAEVPMGELDLRVARVSEAEPHPNADRLLVLRVDLGEESRQIVAGVVGHYQPEELRDLHIVIVANLKPAKLRGEVSQGMLLAAEDEAGRLGVLTAPHALPGTRLHTGQTLQTAEEVTFVQFQAHALRVTPEGVTLDGSKLEGADLVMDREVYGRLR